MARRPTNCWLGNKIFKNKTKGVSKKKLNQLYQKIQTQMNVVPKIMTGYKLFVGWEKTSTVSMSFLARFFDCSDFSFGVFKVDQWRGTASWPEQLWSPRCPLHVSWCRATSETTVFFIVQVKGFKGTFSHRELIGNFNMKTLKSIDIKILFTVG